MTTTEFGSSTTTSKNAERSWRRIGALGMILGVTSLIAATVIQWFVHPNDPAGTPIDVARDHPGAWLLLSLLAVFGSLVWVGGIVAVTMLVRAKGWNLTTLGGYVSTIGLISLVGHLAMRFGLTADVVGAGVDSATGSALLKADEASILSTVVLIVGLAGFSLGPVLLTLGLRRAKLVPVWVPVAAIILVVTNLAGGVPAGIMQALALIATFGPMAVLLARQKEVTL